MQDLCDNDNLHTFTCTNIDSIDKGPVALTPIEKYKNVIYGESSEITLEFANPLLYDNSSTAQEKQDMQGLNISVTKNSNPTLVIAEEPNYEYNG